MIEDFKKKYSKIFLIHIGLLIVGFHAGGQAFLETIEQKFESNPPYGTIHYKYQADTLGDFHYPFQPGNLRHTYFWHTADVFVFLRFNYYEYLIFIAINIDNFSLLIHRNQ